MKNIELGKINRFTLVGNKTSITKEELEEIVEYKHEYAKPGELKKYTEKSFRNLSQSEKESLIDELLKDDYVQYKNCHIARSKLLYDSSDTLIKEITILDKLNDLGYEIYLLPYSYARDSMNCYQKSADSISDLAFIEFKTAISTGKNAGQSVYKDARTQADNVFISFVNETSEQKVINNIYSTIKESKKVNKNYNFEGLVFLNFEKDNDRTVLYHFDKDGAALRLDNPTHKNLQTFLKDNNFKKDKGIENDSQVLENPVTKHGSSPINNIKQESESVNKDIETRAAELVRNATYHEKDDLYFGDNEHKVRFYTDFDSSILNLSKYIDEPVKDFRLGTVFNHANKCVDYFIDAILESGDVLYDVQDKLSETDKKVFLAAEEGIVKSIIESELHSQSVVTYSVNFNCGFTFPAEIAGDDVKCNEYREKVFNELKEKYGFHPNDTETEYFPDREHPNDSSFNIGFAAPVPVESMYPQSATDIWIDNVCHELEKDFGAYIKWEGGERTERTFEDELSARKEVTLISAKNRGFYSWDDIYTLAMETGFGDSRLSAKDNARGCISDIALKFGIDIENSEIPEEAIEDFLKEHPELDRFNEDGQMIDSDVSITSAKKELNKVRERSFDDKSVEETIKIFDSFGYYPKFTIEGFEEKLELIRLSDNKPVSRFGEWLTPNHEGFYWGLKWSDDSVTDENLLETLDELSFHYWNILPSHTKSITLTDKEYDALDKYFWKLEDPYGFFPISSEDKKVSEYDLKRFIHPLESVEKELSSDTVKIIKDVINKYIPSFPKEIEYEHKFKNTIFIQDKEWGDVLVCRFNEKKDGFDYCLFNQHGEISRVQNNPGFYEMDYLKNYYQNKKEILPVDAANVILINNQDGDKNWKRTDSELTYDQQWLDSSDRDISTEEKKTFIDAFELVLNPLDNLVAHIIDNGYDLNDTEIKDLKATFEYWFETWNYELAYDEGELCFLDHDNEYAETLDFDGIKRVLHNMLVSVNDTKDSELDWQKELLQKFEPDPEVIKLKTKYLKAYEKGMESSRQAALEQLPADASKEKVIEEANVIFAETAKPYEIVGYYLTYYPEKYLETWNENTKNKVLDGTDKTVTELLTTLYEKEHTHMHKIDNVNLEPLNLKEYVNSHLPETVGPLSSSFIDNLDIYTRKLSDDLLLYDKVNDKAYRVWNGDKIDYEKTKNKNLLHETDVEGLFNFAEDEAYNYQGTVDAKTQAAEIREAKDYEHYFNHYQNIIKASRFAELTQCFASEDNDKIRAESVHTYAIKLYKENTDILSLPYDEDTGYELNVETNIEGRVNLMYLNKINIKTNKIVWNSVESSFNESQLEIWNESKSFVENYIHASFPEDYEIVADYAFPETYKYINSDGNTIELTTYEEPRWNFRDEKVLLKAVQESDPDFYKKLMEIISEYPDEHFSFDLGKELSYASFGGEKSWNKNHDFSLESLDEKLNNVFRFRYWNNYDENNVEVNNFDEYGEEIVIKDEGLVKKLNTLIEAHVRYNITKYETFKKYREERIPLLIRENFRSIVGEGPLHENDNELYLEGSFLSSELSSLIGLGTDEENSWSDVNGDKYIRKYNIYKLYDLKGGDKINTIPFKFDGDPDRLFIEYYDKNDKVSSTQKLSEDVLPFGTVELVNKCFDEQAAREMHQPLITEKNIINLAKSEISHFDKDFDLPNSHGKRVGRIWTYTLSDDFEKVLGIQGKTYVKDGEEKILYFNLYQDFEYDDNGKIDLSKPSDLLLYEYYNDGIDEINCGVEKISDVLQNNSEYLQRFVSGDISEIKDKIIQTITNSFKNYIRDELDTNEIKLDVEMENNKQRGWQWIHYNDNSGSLHSPSGKSYFSYDWNTKEYTITDDSRWEMFEGAPDEDTSFSAFKKEAEEYVRKNITNGDFELTHKYIDHEFTKNLFVQAVGTDISDELWDEIESRQNERDFNLVCDYEVNSQGNIISFDFKKQDIDNEYNETPTTALEIINEVIAWDDKEVSELHAGTADDKDIQKINQFIKDLEQLRDEIDIDVDVFENCRIDVHNNVEDAYIHITLDNGNVVHIPMEYVSENELDDFWYGFRYKGKDFDLNITGESFTGEKDVYQCAVYSVDETGHVDTADYSSAETVIMDAYHKYIPEMNYKVASDEQILQAFNKAGFELTSPSMLNLFNEELSEFWAEEIVLGPDGKLYWHDIEGENGYEFAVLDKSRISSLFNSVEEALESHLTDEEYYDEEEEMQEAKKLLTELKNISSQYMLVKEVEVWNKEKESTNSVWREIGHLINVKPHNQEQISVLVAAAAKKGFTIEPEQADAILQLVNYDESTFKFVFDIDNGNFAEIHHDNVISDVEDFEGIMSYLESEIKFELFEEPEKYSAEQKESAQKLYNVLLNINSEKELINLFSRKDINSGINCFESDPDDVGLVFGEGSLQIPVFINTKFALDKLLDPDFENDNDTLKYYIEISENGAVTDVLWHNHVQANHPENQNEGMISDSDKISAELKDKIINLSREYAENFCQEKFNRSVEESILMHKFEQTLLNKEADMYVSGKPDFSLTKDDFQPNVIQITMFAGSEMSSWDSGYELEQILDPDFDVERDSMNFIFTINEDDECDIRWENYPIHDGLISNSNISEDLKKELFKSCKKAAEEYVKEHFGCSLDKAFYMDLSSNNIDRNFPDENIIDKETNLTPVQLAGEKFIGELNKNICYYKNNPWVTSKIILDEMKEKNPEEHKLLQKYFKENNIKTREDYIKFFEENLGVVKSVSQVQKKASFNPGENKTVKREKDTEPDFDR